MSTVPVAADGGIVGWVVGLMETLGAPGVGLAIALESVFPPLPSEVFLPLAGFAAARGEMSVLAAIIWTTLGSLVGALVLYGAGAALGRERLIAIADRMPLVDVADVVKAEEWFARHGAKAVFFGRMVPLVRSLVSVPAGLERMSLPLFALLTTAGSLLWNTAFVLAGYGLGANWGVIEPYMSVVSKVVVGLLGVAVVWFVVRRVRARRAAADAVEPAAPPAAEPAAVGPAAIEPVAVEPAAPARPVGPGVDAATVRIDAPTVRIDPGATVRFDRRAPRPQPAVRRPHHPHPHPPAPRQPHPPAGPRAHPPAWNQPRAAPSDDRHRG
ncbi:DedA family protein [Pseudonocardia humida]|uniref:DedA family protein n=1 Tax=Pseudonocardia humida TaxID=2800819 RepID=A0ABT1A444_9PSEU|nr:DedA family protein [Pseudonocardia humida]MCO1657725.1 DedA family protein [Pseudonocardia humida]